MLTEYRICIRCQNDKLYSVLADGNLKNVEDLNGNIAMTPVYHGGMIYVGSDGRFGGVFGLDADTFEVKWRGKRKIVKDPRGTPVIATVDNK